MQNPDFLKKKYDFHNTAEVESAAKRAEIRTGEKVSQNPINRIQNYLDRFNEILDRENPDKRERGIEALKRLLHNKFVIKAEEIPEMYFENQRRIFRERGRGDIEITEEKRKQDTEVIIADQKSTLNKWIDYLSSNDATYPDWLKYYAIRSILDMGEFDKEKKQFTKRSKGTTKPFPDLNREALAYVLDAIGKKQKGEMPSLKKLETEDKDKFKKLLQGENFAKLYAWAIEKAIPATKENLTNIKGKWIKYDRNSDHMPLVKSLQGHGTGWCTAGESTAETQLNEGDFHVYYSFDSDGNPTIPRVAIRMEENSIAEIRGIAHEQNVDEYINPVIDEKLKEFPDGAQYEKKVVDMKTLTAIDNKVKKNQDLTKDDILFLYEVDGSIQGFGYETDPRIKEIIDTRDIKKDLAYAMGVEEKQISLTQEKALSGNIVFHYDNLNLNSLTSAKGLELPQNIGGGLNLRSLTSAKGLKFPKIVSGYLNLRSLKSTKGLELPQSISGTLDLSNLKSAKGLKLPQSIDGDLNLRSLKSAKGLKLPQSIDGDLDLDSLTSTEGLELPQSIDSLYLGSLTSAKGLKFPKIVSGYLNLRSLTSAKGLKLPKSIGGYLDLNSLTSAEGLELSQTSISGYLDLRSLTSAERMSLREKYPNIYIID